MKTHSLKSFLPVLIFSGLIGFLLISPSVRAQTVSSATEKVDQISLVGLSLNLPIEGKFVEKEWETLLKSYGKVTTGRSGVYKVPAANIPALSNEPLNVASKVTADKAKATVFLAVDKGNADYVKPGSTMYDQVETLLKEFAERTRINYDIKLADDTFNEAQKKQEKLVKQGEKLIRDLDRNKKEKDNLVKKMDENVRELEQLTRDTETNKNDQVNSAKELEVKKQALEAARAKLPK
ncbi:hypothetical protein [Larkinella humicola]|uniref:Uncharacterized protein n=1 Tax=Larkinella humicola TaxID=2607654 RepID=A0A5N1JM03_9BACT|nr:hypothetical protein [Larkinella humicola]KAA9357540.1 hypothetical protein F0P93_07370 [Larkinella humicola]